MGSSSLGWKSAKSQIGGCIISTVASSKRAFFKAPHHVWWKWIFFDNTRRGGQWSDFDELPGHCPKPDLFPKKVMVSVWWGSIWNNVANRKGAICIKERLLKKKLSDLGIEVLPHPPYSPDLSPTDYHLSKHLDSFLRNKKLDDQRAVEKTFRRLCRSPESTVFYNRHWKIGESLAEVCRCWRKLFWLKMLTFFTKK